MFLLDKLKQNGHEIRSNKRTRNDEQERLEHPNNCLLSCIQFSLNL